jgi:hypothetical protein
MSVICTSHATAMQGHTRLECQEPGHKCVLFRKTKDKVTLKFKVKVQLALLASHVVILFPLGKCHSWVQCEWPEGQMG